MRNFVVGLTSHRPLSDISGNNYFPLLNHIIEYLGHSVEYGIQLVDIYLCLENGIYWQSVRWKMVD